MPSQIDPDKWLDCAAVIKLRRHVDTQAAQRKSRAAITDALVIYLLTGAGLRAQEACDLDIADLPGSHGKPVLVVRKGKGRGKKKGRNKRVVHIPQELAGRIADYVTEFRKDAGPAEPLFLSWRRTRMQYRVLYDKVRRLGEEIGLRVRPHMLRHSYATYLYESKKDLLFTQRQLGHARPETTAIYAHTAQQEARQQVEEMW